MFVIVQDYGWKYCVDVSSRCNNLIYYFLSPSFGFDIRTVTGQAIRIDIADGVENALCGEIDKSFCRDRKKFTG